MVLDEKKRHCLCLFAILLFSSALFAADNRDKIVDNLLGTPEDNAGFESNAAGTIPGWVSDYSGDGMKVEIVDEPHSGKKSLKLSGGNGLGNFRAVKYIKVEPGYKYFMSVWGKFKNVKFIGTHYGIGFGLHELLADKQTLNGDWYSATPYLRYLEGDIDWSYAEYNNVLPRDNSAYLKVILKVLIQSGGEVWFDDIRVWKEKVVDRTIANEMNLVENGSFELRYQGRDIPFGYEMAVPKTGWDLRRAIAVESERYERTASLRTTPDTALRSSRCFIATNKANVGMAVKTDGDKAKAFANLLYYDKDLAIIRTDAVVAQSGPGDWKVYRREVTNIPSEAKYLQWEFGTKDGSTGNAWFDDLQINVISAISEIPRRPLDIAKCKITVDCSKPGKTFISPLNGLESHRTDRAYSKTIGTRGKFMEDPAWGWFAQRSKLGYRYIRMHELYTSSGRICTVTPNGGNFKVEPGRGIMNSRWCVSYIEQRYDDDGKAIPRICEIDDKGNMKTDFTGIRYVLDRYGLAGGLTPILDLGVVPSALAIDADVHNSPKDFRQWEEFNYRFMKFLLDTYGKEKIAGWIFETGNEPSTECEFHGDPRKGRESAFKEFLKLQDYAVAGLTRAFPEAIIGGPGGPPENWIVPMLEHCAKGTNYATGKTGTKLDCLSSHGYLSGSLSGLAWKPAANQAFRFGEYAEIFRKLTGKQLRLYNGEVNGFYIERGADPNDIRHECNNHLQAIAMLHVGNYSRLYGFDAVCFFFEHPFYFQYWDKPFSEIPEFTGQATSVTYHGIATPVSRAYQMMSMLNGGTEVETKADKEPVWAMATVVKNEIRLLCYSLAAVPTAKYTTRVSLELNPTDIGKTFKVTKYELSDTKANSWYLATQRKLTHQNCEDNPAVVDEINKASELKPEGMGKVNVSENRIRMAFDLKSYSAVLFVFQKIE